MREEPGQLGLTAFNARVARTSSLRGPVLLTEDINGDEEVEEAKVEEADGGREAEKL